MPEKFSPVPVLGLRNDAHEVELIEPKGANRAVLGTGSPAEIARRVKVLKQWGAVGEGPRQQNLAAIELPLEQRHQTILSHQVSAAVAARLNGAAAKESDSRKHQHDAHTIPLPAPDISSSD